MGTDHDSNKDGIVKMVEFPAMMNEFLTVPKKHSLAVPSEGQYETLFKKYDPRNDGRLTVDEWMSLASQEVYKKFIMSTPVNTFNKSKEDFIWFVKKAVNDKKSYSHSEMYQSLLKLFVDADTNKDGLVSRASFSKLIDDAAAMPRAYGYAPADSELYKTEAEKDASRQKMFDSMDLKSTGVITFDEWLKFCREHN